MDLNQFPIDIHCSKLLDWVLDRRLCPREWSKNVLLIRNKINLAIQDMPEHHEIADLLSGSTIHYFNCLKIIEILKETEKQSKNIFGMYSSQRMKDWNNITSLYQKNSIYLAEASSFLQRNTTYEIPSLKKQITRAQQMQNDCEEKYNTLGKSINEINYQLKKSYEELGIKGEDLALELKMLPDSLDPVYDNITSKCKQLELSIDYYRTFVEYFHKRDPKDILPYLSYLIKNGNTTVFEWRTGIVPKSIEKSIIEYRFAKSSENKVQADDNEINFDLNGVTLDETGEIDWGDTELINDSNVGVEEVVCVEEDSLKDLITVEETGVYIPEDYIAKGDDALSLLEFYETRNFVFQDLCRLFAFMKQRHHEVFEGDNLMSTIIMQDSPKLLQSTTEKEIKRFLDLIIDVRTYLASKKLEQLFLIRDSPRYLERVYDKFKQKFKAIERHIRTQEEMKIKSKEFTNEINQLNKKLKVVIKKTKELQKFITDDLSKRYNGTRVNLMGEINTL